MRSTRLGHQPLREPVQRRARDPGQQQRLGEPRRRGLAQDPRRRGEHGEVEQQPLDVLARGLAERRPREARGGPGGQRRERGQRRAAPGPARGSGRGSAIAVAASSSHAATPAAARRRVGVAAREQGDDPGAEQQRDGEDAVGAGAHRRRRVWARAARASKVPRRAHGPPSTASCCPGLAVLAFALALLQRPGTATSDTKIGLHVDPVGFLGDVAAAWSPTEDLGHVQGGQYGGYLFPMGPFFALGRLLGLSPWLVQRLWLGLVLALAAWGMVRLMDALAGPPARRRAPGRRAAVPAQPVRGGVHRAHVGDAARLRGAAVAAAVRVPRAAGAALVVVAGGVRARGRLHGRRRQRRGHGVGAARAAAAGALRARDPRRSARGRCSRSAGGPCC